MAETPFVHLHCHTDYSLLDGACEIGQLMDLVVEQKMPSVAMTVVPRMPPDVPSDGRGRASQVWLTAALRKRTLPVHGFACAYASAAWRAMS